MKSDSLQNSLKARIFLDTNILSYLVDDTYPYLTSFIRNLQKMCCVDILSSDYCRLEYVGIRKREHYLRQVVDEAHKKNKILNFSSLLKYHNQFSCEEISFAEIKTDIEQHVDKDIDTIATDYGIKFLPMHEDVIKVAKNICLKSRISREDSLVLASTIDFQQLESIKNCIVLTNDTEFAKEANISEINNIFQQVGLDKGPIIANIANIWNHNLCKNEMPLETIISQITSIIITNSSDHYVGESYEVEPKFGPDLIAFKAPQHISQNQYVCILSKDLKYCFNIPNKLAFYHKGLLVSDFEGLKPGNDVVSAKVDYSSAQIDDADYAEMMGLLRQEGNLVFTIH